MYNLVYIHTHDTGRSISPYGYSCQSDNLLALAREATLFTHAYSCAPTCSPSRAAMLTGQLPHQTGMLGLAHRGFFLTQPRHHLANYLASQGYHTVISGVQHEHGRYTDLDPEGLNRLGYQEILTVSAQDKPCYVAWDRQNALRAACWIRENDDEKPFFLAYGMNATHRPYPEASGIDPDYVRPAFPGENNADARQDEAAFQTSVRYADENVGLIIQALKEKGIYDNTVILFTTDHGVANPFQKCHLNDFGIGVSLILRHPVYGQGLISDQLVSHLDVYPTLCEMLNLPAPGWLEGVSLVSLLKDGKPVRDRIYAEINFHTSYEPARCVRTERYKYIRYFDENWLKTNPSNTDESAQKSFLLKHGLADRRKPAEALYDCYYDPTETHNVINESEYLIIADQLRNDLKKNMEATDDPLLRGHLEIKPCHKVNKKGCLLPGSRDPEDYEPQGRC